MTGGRHVCPWTHAEASVDSPPPTPTPSASAPAPALPSYPTSSPRQMDSVHVNLAANIRLRPHGTYLKIHPVAWWGNLTRDWPLLRRFRLETWARSDSFRPDAGNQPRRSRRIYCRRPPNRPDHLERSTQHR